MNRERRLIEIISGQDRSVGAWLLRGVLRVASWCYAVTVSVRNWTYDWGIRSAIRAEIPVISVGNMTTGGTGKTPVVMYVARLCRQRGRRVAILSRGYRALVGSMENDEARELMERLPDVPLLLGADRVESARIAAMELEMELCLLDDGYQHRRLHRNADIVLIDALVPFGYGYCLPRGLLREPLRGLARADVLLITRAEAVSSEECQRITTTLRRWNRHAPVLACRMEPIGWLRADGQREGLHRFAGQPVAMLCAIGNPGGFRSSLQRLGLTIVGEFIFEDHHEYTAEELNGVYAQAIQRQAELILCTHKDLVKIRRNRVGTLPLWALEIEACLGDEEVELQKILNSVLESESNTMPCP